MCQRRKLLDLDIFKCINNLFLRSFDNYKTINGYYIFAQDCSDINIPFMDDDTKVHYEDGRKPSCQYHINALYDCLNHIFYVWNIDAASKKSEPDALSRLSIIRIILIILFLQQIEDMKTIIFWLIYAKTTLNLQSELKISKVKTVS